MSLYQLIAYGAQDIYLTQDSDNIPPRQYNMMRSNNIPMIGARRYNNDNYNSESEEENNDNYNSESEEKNNDNYNSESKEENNYNASIRHKRIKRKIIDDKNYCGITLSEILHNRSYMNCNNCNNNFRKYSLNVWLNRNNSCPLCRCKWLDFNVYINCD
jgi:FtsZ-interacting cell division protein YlmF